MLREAVFKRLERAIAPHLRQGWDRVVFAAPQASGDRIGTDASAAEQVLAGPGVGVVPAADQLAVVFAAARAAAQAGMVKHTYVLDARRRVQVDARHGRPTLRTLDEASVRKVMGGKDRPLRPDTSDALLREIGIMNADGSISASRARKYKQVNHLAELCRPTWERLVAQARGDRVLRILDLACGNAYLSFVLADVLRRAGVALRLHGVDVREDVVARSRTRAVTLAMAELSFAQASIRDAEASAELALGGVPDLVVALHACDTATDEALALAIAWGTPAVLCVPCCQHELAGQLGEHDPAIAPVPALLQHGLLRGAYADLLTDSLRVELLQACGYDVTVLEFVASTHTPKNLLLRAHRRHPHARVDPTRWHLAAVAERCAALGVRPTLLADLQARAAQAAASD